MPLFCEVALPVPLDRTFTYGVGEGQAAPEVGARVLVPFSGQRLSGVVVRVHAEAPTDFEVKPIQQVLDDGPLLPEELMRLAGWIAGYYVAPLGEVLRGMLPLAAEVRRQMVYRIAEQGRTVLYEGAAKGSSRRSRLTATEQDREYAVLNYLEAGDAAKLTALRGATGAAKSLLDGMVRKRWLLREAVAEGRDGRRMERYAVLADGLPADAEMDEAAHLGPSAAALERKPACDNGGACGDGGPGLAAYAANAPDASRRAGVDGAHADTARARAPGRGRGAIRDQRRS